MADDDRSRPGDSGGVEVRLGARASGAYERRQARRRTALRGGLIAGGAALAVAGLAVGLVVVRGSFGAGVPAQGQVPSAATGAGPVGPQPTGPALAVSTAQGDAYSLAAVDGGSSGPSGAGSGSRSPAGSGQTYAYADYVLTNTLGRRILLAAPADLLVRETVVPDEFKPRCTPQPGAPDAFCELPSTSKVIGLVEGSAAPFHDAGDDYMPARASYLVRITTLVPVDAAVRRADLGVYVCNVLYVPDREARPVPFPASPAP